MTTMADRVAQLEAEVERLRAALEALLEQNYPYREARARALLFEREKG